MREANLQTDTKRPEPCENAVSRKAVEEMLQNGFPERGMWEVEGDIVRQTVCETLVDALMDLEKLPSVTPKQKRGKWEEKAVSDEKVIDEWQSARCSACDKYHTAPYMYYFNNYNYCPNCGADMRGEQDE